MRGTRVGELEKENHVLMTEVDRLRQLNEFMHKKMISRTRANQADMLALQKSIAELQLERQRCLCMSGIYSQGGKSWIRCPEDTLTGLKGRSTLAHEALEHTVNCCQLVLASGGIDLSSSATQEIMQLLESLASRHELCGFCCCNFIVDFWQHGTGIA